MFSDPPLNELAVDKRGDAVTRSGRQLGRSARSRRLRRRCRVWRFRADAAARSALAEPGALSFRRHGRRHRTQRLRELRSRRCRRRRLGLPGRRACTIGAQAPSVDVDVDPARVFAFDSPGERVRGARQADARAAWPASRSTASPTPTAASRATNQDYALKPLHHVWEHGMAYALLGPSGCGKTTLLNIISGLVIPSEGRLLFDERDVTQLPTEQRNIAQVFQFPVIYDTMTVAENLAFPLRNRRLPKSVDQQARRRDRRHARPHADLNRRARGLTADAKQKISLGRGLVRADVSAVLFDEPLTVIDPALKWELRSKLKAVHRALDLLMIYVTHDQTEALTFADRVVVMNDGRAVQIGTPAELFERPEHTFVGYFIGSPGMNFLPARGRKAHAPRGRRRSRARRALRGPAEGRQRADRRAARIRRRWHRRPAWPCRCAASPISAASGWRTSSSAAHPMVATVPDEMDGVGGEAANVVDRPRRHPRLSSTMFAWRGGGMMDKPINNRAWFFVLPVLGFVLFSSLVPVMTVVNYSVQDSMGANNFFWNGDGWFRDLLDPSTEIGARFDDALLRTLAFSFACAADRDSARHRHRAVPAARGWAVGLSLVIMALPMLIPWNVVGTIWQIFTRADIGLFGAGADRARACLTT